MEALAYKGGLSQSYINVGADECMKPPSCVGSTATYSPRPVPPIPNQTKLKLKTALLVHKYVSSAS